jgi:predicted Zn finger-like uncharacterized protein
MKIVCDSCSTKYSISDDKVRGKVFKIRCKKCSHIIVVRGTTDEVPAAVPETSTEAVWHLVIDGEQVGPLTDPEVRAQLARGEVSGENYIWKEGFADWVKLGTVPSFADAVAAAPPPAGGEAFPEATAVSAQGGEAGYFGSGGHDARGFGGSGGVGSGGYASTSSSSGRTRATAQAAADEDAFSIPAVSASAGSTDLFGAASPMAPAAEAAWGRGSNGSSGRHDGGRIENLTAQRSENSVLFSLANLQSLAAPAAAAAQAKVAAPQSSEGSGLIDIRAMAASTLRAPVSSGGPALSLASSSTRDDDLPAFGGFSAAPLLLPMPSASGPPKWVYALIAMAVVLVVAAFALAYSIFTRPVVVEQPAPPPAPVAPAPAAAAPAAAAAAKPAETPGSAAIAESDLPPREGGAAAAGTPGAGAEKAPDKATKSRGKPKKPGGAAAAGATAVAAAPAAPAAPSEPERPRPAKGSIDDLLEGALGARRQPVVREDKRAAPAAAEPASSGPLAKEAVVKGMNGVRPKVAECYTQFKVPGQVMVSVVIGKNGKVTTATAGGKFAGTPTGACVEKAVKNASFPPSDGLTTMYPFLLR